MPSVLTFNNHGLKFQVGQKYVRIGAKSEPVVQYPYLLYTTLTSKMMEASDISSDETI